MILIVDKISDPIKSIILSSIDGFSDNLRTSFNLSPVFLTFNDLLKILDSELNQNELVVFFTNILEKSFSKFIFEFKRQNETIVQKLSNFTFILIPFLSNADLFYDVSKLYLFSKVNLNIFTNIIKEALESKDVDNENKIELLRLLTKNYSSEIDTFNFKKISKSVPHVDLTLVEDCVLFSTFKNNVTLDIRKPYVFRCSVNMALFSSSNNVPISVVHNNFHVFNDFIATRIPNDKFQIELKHIDNRSEILNITILSFELALIRSLDACISNIIELSNSSVFANDKDLENLFLKLFFEQTLKQNHNFNKLNLQKI